MPELECEPPIPLIKIEVDNRTQKEVFSTNIKALNELKKIDTPIGVFSVCGAQGTGKSYLLNCILDLIGDKSDKAFKVAKQVVAKAGMTP